MSEHETDPTVVDDPSATRVMPAVDRNEAPPPAAAPPSGRPATGPSSDVATPAPADRRRSQRGWWIAIAVVLGVIGVLAVLLVRQDDASDVETVAPSSVSTTVPPPSVDAPDDGSAPSTAAPSTSAPTSAPTTATPASREITDAAVTYVETLDAGEFDRAWSLTSPRFQEAQDRGSWQEFWSGFESIDVVGDARVDEGTGRVVLPLSFDGSREDYEMTLVEDGAGRWLVDGPVG